MKRHLLLVILTLSLFLPAFAQQMADVEQGLKPYGTYHGGEIDSISMTNGNLTLQIPLTSYAQRGRISTDEWLSYNAKNFVYTQQCSETETPVDGDPEPIFGHPMFCTERIVRNADSFGPAVHTPNDATVLVSMPVVQTDGTNTTYEKLVTVYSGDGSGHQLGFIGSAQALGYGPAGSIYRSVDGTGWLFRDNEDYGASDPSSGTGTLWFPNGNVASISYSFDGDGGGGVALAKAVTDPDGNYIGTTDTMGRSATLTFQNTPSPLCPNLNLPYQSLSSSQQVSYADGKMITYCYAGINVHTDFIPAHNEYNFEMVATWNMIQSVVISATTAAPGDPHNLVWSFIYDSASNFTDSTQPGYYAYGEMQKVIFPTGGTLSYTWGAGGFCQLGGPDGRAYPVNNHAVASRTLDAADGTGPHTWNYSWSLIQNGVDNGYGPTFTNIVTDPLVAGDAAANETVHYASPVVGCGLYETETDWFQGPHSSGTLLKKLVKHYHAAPNGLDTGYTQTAADVFEDSETTTLNSSVSTTTTTAYNSTFNYGQLQVVENADSPPVWGGGVAANPIHVQEPSAVMTYGYDGALTKETDYQYAWQSMGANPYWLANLLNTPTVTTVKDGAGNPKSQTTYAYDEQAATGFTGCTVTNHGAAPASVRGHVTSTTLWLNGGTSPQFKTTWYDTGTKYQTKDAGNNTTTYNYCDTDVDGAWPTSIVNALGQTNYFTYNLAQGTEATAKDSNGQITQYSWDYLPRLQNVTFPTGGGQTAFTYPNPNQAQRQQQQDASTWITDTASFDGVGRAKQTVHSNPNQGDEMVDITYDAMGRLYSLSNPHRAAAAPTDGFTYHYYDALGRETQTIKQDGSTVNNTYAANCETSTDESGRPMQWCSDALGRMTQVNEPGITAPTSGQGSITIGGQENTAQEMNSAGSPGTASFTVNGAEQAVVNPFVCDPDSGECVKQRGTFYDSGAIYVTVGTFGTSVGYGSGSTTVSVAGDLANALNVTGSPVAASASGATVHITARVAGAATDYALSSSSSTSQTTYFTDPSFSAAPSGANMTGGSDPSYFTAYDTGTVNVSANGHTTSVNYGSGDSASVIAQRLATAISADGSASISANSYVAGSTQIPLVSRSTGVASNYVVTAWSATTSQYFSSGSFIPAAAGLSGGGDSQSNGLSSPAVTLYAYDALGDLLSVQQQGYQGTASSQYRNRSFTYDSLGRLLTATNPETGTVSYSYTNTAGGLCAGDVALPCSKTDARGVTTSFTYDQLHRMTSKSYTIPSGSSAVSTSMMSFSYDSSPGGVTTTNAVGRLTEISNNVNAATSYSYDAMGRITWQSNCIPSYCGWLTNPITATYNLAGDMTLLTYPSGRTVNFSFDPAGRLNDVNASFSGTPYHYYTVPSTNGFLPGGTAANVNLGNATNEVYALNDRLQPCEYQLKFGSSFLIDRSNLYTSTSTNCTTYSPANNGNVIKIVDNLDNNKSQWFAYDSLNRIASATTVATVGPDAWSQTFSYDAFGNMNQAGSLIFSQTFGANNRINSGAYTYDAAGDLTYDGNHNYAYDAESQIASIDSAATTYTYDANGQRVRKSTGSNFTEYVYFGGEPIAEKDQAGNWTDYIFAGGRRIAMATGTASSGTTYFHSDNLGSQRLMTDASGSVVSGTDRTYLPFGWEWNATTAGSHYKFTGKERDAETGLDEFPKRYYGNALGRWMTPDPLPWIDWQHGNREEQEHFAEYISNPQNFNMYAYVANNPESRDDPTGMEGCQAGDKKFSTCTITVTYNKKTSEGTLVVTGQNKGDKNPTVLLKADVVVGGNGHVTPTGKFTASVWEKDHVSTKYGNLANTPWSKTTFGGNAFGPYQLHIKELEGQGIYLHGTMGPGWSPTTKISGLAVSATSHGCVRMCNRDDIALHNMMPNPAGNRIVINSFDPDKE